MLFNPHWDAPSLSSFEAWLETKDPSETYVYSDCNNCACAQYLKHIGKFNPKWLGNAKWDDPITRMNAIAGGSSDNGFSHKGHTFGELLGRVRQHRAAVTA